MPYARIAHRGNQSGGGARSDRLDPHQSVRRFADSFFKKHDHFAEDERRLLAQKWNTVMHAEHGKRVTLLNEPCFDLHYIARAPGRSTNGRRCD